MTEILQVEALPGYEPEIGRWLWALQDVRRRTLRAVEGICVRVLDWSGPAEDSGGGANAVGTLLYHIALIEMDWLYADLLCRPFPDRVLAEFPQDARTPDGRLTPMLGIALEEHVGRLQRTRAWLLHELEGMTLDDWRRPRAPEGAGYRATPEWIVYHLVEHEAGHAYQIAQVRRRGERFFG